MSAPALSSIARGVPDIDLLRALAATNRQALENMISVSIDLLDSIDGDADEQDGTSAEDEPCAWFRDPAFLRQKGENIAGCSVSDPGGYDEDGI